MQVGDRLDLQVDAVVGELRSLAPEVLVEGGSFAHWLPELGKVSAENRHSVLQCAKEEATACCLGNLLVSAGLERHEPKRLPSGPRDWPAGYVGSVSRKGTKIVAALARRGQWAAIGIDIETRSGSKELAGVPGLCAATELPPGVGDGDSVVVLSVKEAIFKALHPVLGQPMGFDDVSVSWKAGGRRVLYGETRCNGRAVQVRCSMAVRSWVVSVALTRA